LSTVCLDIDILISTCILLLVFAASCLADDFSIFILGYMFGGCIGSIVVNKLVSALMLFAKKFDI